MDIGYRETLSDKSEPFIVSNSRSFRENQYVNMKKTNWRYFILFVLCFVNGSSNYSGGQIVPI